MVDDADVEIPESTREILKVLEVLLAKKMSDDKVESWVADFETLAEDMKNHKQSQTLVKLLKKCESILRLLSSKNEEPKPKSKKKNRNRKRPIPKKKLEADYSALI